jgi:multiple sugar transport system substrate-binding protein
VASPTAEILSSLAPNLERSKGINLKIAAIPYEDLYHLLSAGLPNSDKFDLIRIDMAWAEAFESKIYQPLPWQPHNLLPALTQEGREGLSQRLGPKLSIPFDPSILMLFYRRDLFESPRIKRLYYEKTGETLKIPRNYRDYDKAAAFFSSALNPQSPTRFGTTLVYGSGATAASEILPRLRSLGASVFDEQGRFRLDTPAFVRGFKQYLGLRACADVKVNYWWDDALRSFSAGDTAMSLIFINHASSVVRGGGREFKAGAAALDFPLLGGGLLGLGKESKKLEECAEFLSWVYSDEIANMVGLLGGMSACASVYENEEILELYPWLRGIDRAFKQGWRRIRSPLRPHFDSNGFERILGGALRNAALGLATPEEALKSAQQLCETRFQ